MEGNTPSHSLKNKEKRARRLGEKFVVEQTQDVIFRSRVKNESFEIKVASEQLSVEERHEALTFKVPRRITA